MDPLALEPTPADPYPPEGSVDQVEDLLAYLDTMHQRYKAAEGWEGKRRPLWAMYCAVSRGLSEARSAGQVTHTSGFTSWGIGMDAEATEAFGDWRQRLIEDGIAPPTDQS